MKKWIGTNQLIDTNGEILAQFLIMKDDSDNETVLCIPFFGMFWIYREMVNNILIRFPAEQLTQESYLGYLATLAGANENAQLAYEMRRIDSMQYVSLKLVKGMGCKTIAALTGWELSYIREFYRNYIVVSNDPI